MSMSTRVVGFRPPDEKWNQMKVIWDACKAAGIRPPTDVETFFDGREPEPRGIEIRIPAEKWNDGPNGVSEGFEVEVAKIPDHVTHIRFINSW